MMKKETPQAPLTPAVLHILLALSTGERHGYGIMKQVEADSQGKVKMGPGTLYGSMGRMMEAGLIRESDKISGSIQRWMTSGGSITSSQARGGRSWKRS
jgi:Transcriptional regulator PadR-like family